MTECPSCEGHGRVEAGPGDRPYPATCPTCNGRRVVDEDTVPMAPGHDRVLRARAAKAAERVA